MTSNTSIVTLLVKACPKHLLSKVVHAIEAYGFDRAFLVTALNTAPEQVLQSAKSAKSAKSTKAPGAAAAEGDTSVYDSIIYMKITAYDVAVEGMKSFVEDNLNAEHGTSMYCVEIKPRKYQTLFPVLFMHEEVPNHQEMMDLFSPFGKCNIRTKNEKMTYINYKVFEQVEALLAAMDNSQLKFQHMVVHKGVYPVQNSKLMMPFETTFQSEYEDIVSNNSISKQQLTTWFNDMKKKASCEKTWDELVDFLSERIWQRFNWTYNANMEAFCATAPEVTTDSAASALQNDACDATPDANDATNPITSDNHEEGIDKLNALTADVASVDCEECADGLDAVHTGHEIGTYPIFHETSLWNDNVHCGIHNNTLHEGDENVLQNEPIVYNNNHHHCVVDRMNNIPLYGDESHPLHIRLCALEQQLFGKNEEANVSIHHRLMNMEMMMNINGEDQALPVRLTDLSCWIQQYLLCV